MIVKKKNPVWFWYVVYEEVTVIEELLLIVILSPVLTSRPLVKAFVDKIKNKTHAVNVTNGILFPLLFLLYIYARNRSAKHKESKTINKLNSIAIVCTY